VRVLENFYVRHCRHASAAKDPSLQERIKKLEVAWDAKANQEREAKENKLGLFGRVKRRFMQGPRDNYDNEPDAMDEPVHEKELFEDETHDGPDFDFAAAFDSAEQRPDLLSSAKARLRQVEARATRTFQQVEQTATEALHGAKGAARTALHDGQVIRVAFGTYPSHLIGSRVHSGKRTNRGVSIGQAPIESVWKAAWGGRACGSFGLSRSSSLSPFEPQTPRLALCR